MSNNTIAIEKKVIQQRLSPARVRCVALDSFSSGDLYIPFRFTHSIEIYKRRAGAQFARRNLMLSVARTKNGLDKGNENK